jgi:ferrous iron transport protein B
MTVMTAAFIPCSAKIPIVAFIAGSLYGGSVWIATLSYFAGVGAVFLSGLILKKTKPFQGKPSPFIMEFPSYQFPKLFHIVEIAWHRAWGFMKRATTVVFASAVLLWVFNSFSFDGGFHYLSTEQGGSSILSGIGKPIAFLFRPLGFGKWETAVATVLGLFAKEEVIGALGTLSGMEHEVFGIGNSSSFDLDEMGKQFFSSPLEGMSFLLFNLLCAPCVAAMGAIYREMKSLKWTVFAVSYMCTFAYAISLIVYQFGSLFVGRKSVFGICFAGFTLLCLLYSLLRKPS